MTDTIININILDTALLCSNYPDCKIEFLWPSEEAQARITQIHFSKVRISLDVNGMPSTPMTSIG